MIPFNFRLFFRHAFRVLFPAPGTLHRPGFLQRCRYLGNLLAFGILELFNALCLLLDEIFFPGYRRVRICNPVFIIGTPRSGTTFLHRTLSQDSDRFFVFRTWEILFPSVLQKKIGSFIGRVDRSFGGFLKRLIERIERRTLGEFHDLHPTGLFYPEEDEMLFLHCFMSPFLMFFFSSNKDLIELFDFDRNLAASDRERLMRFYCSCLKRQAYARGPSKTFLSKNPTFCGKIASLHETFPDARFVYLVRNPLDAIPSMISEGYATCVYAAKGSLPPPAFQNSVYEVAKTSYRYPLSYLDSHPSCVAVTVKFRELVQDPLGTVTGLYERLGYGMSAEFLKTLELEQERTRGYRSSHRYTLEQFVIPADRIVRDLDEVFTRFGFARPAAGARAPASPCGSVTSAPAQQSCP